MRTYKLKLTELELLYVQAGLIAEQFRLVKSNAFTPERRAHIAALNEKIRQAEERGAE